MVSDLVSIFTGLSLWKWPRLEYFRGRFLQKWTQSMGVKFCWDFSTRPPMKVHRSLTFGDLAKQIFHFISFLLCLFQNVFQETRNIGYYRNVDSYTMKMCFFPIRFLYLQHKCTFFRILFRCIKKDCDDLVIVLRGYYIVCLIWKNGWITTGNIVKWLIVTADEHFRTVFGWSYTAKVLLISSDVRDRDHSDDMVDYGTPFAAWYCEADCCEKHSIGSWCIRMVDWH